MKHPSDDIILDFKKGNARAFKIVYEHFYPPLFYFAFRMTSDKEQAEDIVLEIFTRLHERCQQFETYTNIKAFLYISTRNLSVNYLKNAAWRDKRHKEFAEKIQDDTELTYHYSIIPDLLDEIHKAVNVLPEQCGKVFKMMFFDDLKPVEIAAKLNISVDNVYSQKRRALQILRLALADHLWAPILLFYISISLDASSCGAVC